MPGITGCVRLGAGAPFVLPTAAELVAPLVCEPGYIRWTVVDTQDAVAVAVGPDTGWSTVGGACCPASGIHAGFYGEFYGDEFRDSERSTADILLQAYQRRRDRLPLALDGSFAVFVWDSKAGEGLLFNDHAGSRPVYFAEQDGLFYFSPEPKGIARLAGFRSEVDELAFVTFLSQGNLLGARTYYRNINALPPGSLVRLAGGKSRVERVWRYVIPEAAQDRGLDFYIDGLSAALTGAIRKRIHRAPHAVIPLSGGYDSRGILATVRRLSEAKLRTVSWGTEESTQDADAFIGRQIAKQFGTEHLFFRRDPATLPSCIEEMVERVDGMTADPALHYCEVQAMRTIRRELGCSYLFRGDEVFGFCGAAADEREALGRVGIRDIAEYPDMVRLFAPSRSREFVGGFRAFLRTISEECPQADFTARKDYYYFYQRMFNYLHRATYYKLTVLEVGNPWLDREVLEFYAGVPIPYRVHKILYRRTLERMYPELMQVRVATRNSLEDWPRVLAANEPLRRFLRHHLLERKTRVDELLDRPHLERLFAMVEQGAPGVSARVRCAGWIKEALRRTAPALYGRLKRQAGTHVRVAAIPAYEMLFRVLVLKLWCGRQP